MTVRTVVEDGSVIDTATLTAADIMSTPVVTIQPHESLWTAWELLWRSGLHHLVVCSEGHVVGVLDDRRVLLEWPAGPAAPQRRQVTELLPRHTSCVLPDTKVSTIGRLMLAENIDVVPVVDEHGMLRGVVTDSDMVRVVAGEAAVRGQPE